jgi:hypothetical protein
VAANEVRLDLLGSLFAIRSDSSDWIDLVAELWEPFLTTRAEEDHLTFEISGTSGDWWLVTGADEPEPDDDPWTLLDTIRYTMIQDALERAKGTVGLHAGVVAKDGFGLLLPGASKSGKTTLTLALVRAGWSYMSDDLAPLSGGEDLVVAPFPKPLSIRNPADWQSVAEWWARPSWLPPAKDTIVVPARALPRTEEFPVTPRLMAFPSFSEVRLDRPRWEEMSSAEAVTRCGPLVSRVDKSSLFVLTRACQRVLAGRLEYDSSEFALEALDQLVNRG